jgi:hypothetical protein
MLLLMGKALFFGGIRLVLLKRPGVHVPHHNDVPLFSATLSQLTLVVWGLVAAFLAGFFSLLLLTGAAFLIGGIGLVMIECPRWLVMVEHSSGSPCYKVVV